MTGPAFVLFVASTVMLAGCNKLAEVLAPDRSVAKIEIILPSTILVGDTVQARANALRSDGKPAVEGDTTPTWASSDPNAVYVDSRGRVTGIAAGGHATITATIGKVVGSISVTVGDDQRLGYALADQPTLAGPYAPDANYRFNSSGGSVDVTRSSTGVYAVRFAGLARPSGGRDNVLVTGYGSAPGVFCKLAGWQPTGSDLTADVRCFSTTGSAADSRFTILLSGARPYVQSSRLGFALVPDFGGVSTGLSLDTLPTSRNNFSGAVNAGRGTPGEYSVVWPGLERVTGSGPETVQITAVGVGPERCRVAAVDSPHASVGVTCTTTGGAEADSRFSVIWLSRGRPSPLRFGYALADKATSLVDYTPNTAFGRNNSGGTITARELGVGQYQVVFQGLGKVAGATETVLVTPVINNDLCDVKSWGNSGAGDLTVFVSCFDNAGTPANSEFFVLLIE